MEHRIYDLTRLSALREALETLDLTAPPTARLLFPEEVGPARRVGILCGSFNPLTLAHTELTERTRGDTQLDRVLFSLAKVTVEKEKVTGLGLEDRLLLLSLYVQHHPSLGVAVVNRGLYFEQAQAFRALLGSQVELSFIVGMDKLIQILDPRYYQDREAALHQLFASTSLIVANRGEMAQEEFDQLLDRPENRPYRSHIRFCALPATIADLSATAIRTAIAAGEAVSEQVPAATLAFLTETQAYKPPVQSDGEVIDAYAVRLRLLAALYTVRSWAERGVNFHALLHTALSADERGYRLRAAAERADVVQLIRSCQ